ncbi:hypothetical protein AABB24_016291, partial [Solanum stoloniferum]
LFERKINKSKMEGKSMLKLSHVLAFLLLASLFQSLMARDLISDGIEVLQLPVENEGESVFCPDFISSNMDNQTKILVNRIYEKMKTVDESIDDKSQKLFKIRDELSKLSEQSRILQSELNQLSTAQAENMREFILLYEHLDTRPSQNSNLKENINPSKVAGDVPLAPSAKNISMVSTDMPISASKDEEKSRTNEATSSSSAKAEKIIFGKPESKLTKFHLEQKFFLHFRLENSIQRKKSILLLPDTSIIFQKKVEKHTVF